MTFTPPVSDPVDREPIRIHSVDELIAYLPYALGHTPHQALVVVALRRKEMLLTANISFEDVSTTDSGPMELVEADRPVTGAQGPEGDPRRASAEQLMAGLLRAGADSLHLFVHEKVPGEGDRLVSAVVTEAQRAGIRIGGHVVIRGDRKWLPQSPDVRERVDGVSITAHPDSPAVMASMLKGCAPLADRGQLRALVEEDASLSGPIATVLATGERRVARHARAWGRCLGRHGSDAWAPGSGSPHEVAGMLLSLGDVHWRDALIAWCAPGSLPIDALPTRARRALQRHVADSPSDPHATLRTLMALARCAPDARPDVTAPIATVVGCVAWHLGEGATARDAFERALRVDPGYRLAQLGLHVIQLAIRPPHPGRGRWIPSATGTAV